MADRLRSQERATQQEGSINVTCGARMHTQSQVEPSPGEHLEVLVVAPALDGVGLREDADGAQPLRVDLPRECLHTSQRMGVLWLIALKHRISISCFVVKSYLLGLIHSNLSFSLLFFCEKFVHHIEKMTCDRQRQQNDSFSLTIFMPRVKCRKS